MMKNNEIGGNIGHCDNEIDLLTRTFKNEVYIFPKELDEKMAKLHLAALGAELAVLAQEQAVPKGVKVQGPLKGGALPLLSGKFGRECCLWQRVWLRTSCGRKHVGSLHRSQNLRSCSSQPM